MSEPHPYCTQHDQPLDWCLHPRVYQDRDGELWLDPGRGKLVALDEPLLRRIRDKYPEQERDRIEAEFGPLRELEAREADLEAWPRCPDGCSCRLGTEDADARECGCDGPCTMECRENGYPDASPYRDLAVRPIAERGEGMG